MQRTAAQSPSPASRLLETGTPQHRAARVDHILVLEPHPDDGAAAQAAAEGTDLGRDPVAQHLPLRSPEVARAVHRFSTAVLAHPNQGLASSDWVQRSYEHAPGPLAQLLQECKRD